MMYIFKRGCNSYMQLLLVTNNCFGLGQRSYILKDLRYLRQCDMYYKNPLCLKEKKLHIIKCDKQVTVPIDI